MTYSLGNPAGSYQGVRAQTPPNIKTYLQPPTTRDAQNFVLGDEWLVKNSAIPENGNCYKLTSLADGIANWALFSSGAGGIESLQTDDNLNVYPLAGVINLHGTHGLNTTGATAHTATVAINNSIVLGDLATIPANNSAITLTTGDATITAGNINVSVPNSAGTKGVLNVGANPFLHAGTTGNNVFLGLTIAGDTFSTTGGNNVVIGSIAGFNLSTGTNNVYLGPLVSTGSIGSRNTVIGFGSGTHLTAGSDNIYIHADGASNESNTIRIGTNAVQTSAFMSGIYGVTQGGTTQIVTVNSTDQLGTTSLSTGTWTPTLTFGGASVGITYTSQAGKYTQIDNTVFITGTIILSNKGSSTGIAAVTGLPFSSGSFAGLATDFTLNYINVTLDANFVTTWGNILSTNPLNQINLVEATADGVEQNLADTNFTNTSVITIYGTYWTS